MHQVSGGHAGSLLPSDTSAAALTALVASGNVDLMAAYEQVIPDIPLGADFAVGCIESARSDIGADGKRAVLVAASNLSKRRDLALSGKEGLNSSGLYSEATERSVSRLGPVQEAERMVFAKPQGTITCVLIREGHR